MMLTMVFVIITAGIDLVWLTNEGSRRVRGLVRENS